MLLLGNIISFVGCLLMIGIGLIKNKKHILLAQCGQFSLQGLAHLVLGAVSGAVSCYVGVLRIFVFSRFKKVPSWLKVLFLAGQSVITVLLGAQTFSDWLPVLSMVLYTWYLDTEDAVLFKLVNMAGVVMWVFYDFMHHNYSAFAFDLLTIISTTTGIFMVLRDRKNKKEEIVL